MLAFFATLGRTPGLYHHVSRALAVAFVICTVLTLDTANLSADRSIARGQVVIMILAAFTIVLLSMLIPFTSHQHPTHPSSRAGRHFYFLNGLSAAWMGVGAWALLYSAQFPSEPMRRCEAAPFPLFGWWCLLVLQSLMMPLGVVLTLLCAAWTTYVRAIMPRTRVKRPLLAAEPETTTTPNSSWMLVHVAESEESDAELELRLEEEYELDEAAV
uniref:Uncharacterized protein n=1 Tax=Mycena chlorophos TaxID=658473 RepID=A0ABQ0L115_MYCCL|nr:predicted protein [Mycena chlorophos]